MTTLPAQQCDCGANMITAAIYSSVVPWEAMFECAVCGDTKRKNMIELFNLKVLFQSRTKGTRNE